MMRADHEIQFEQLMACLDGELPPEEAASVRAHVRACPARQQMEAELREVSGRLATWTVDAPPASLSSPPARARMAGLRRWMPVAAALVVATGVGTLWLARLSLSRPSEAMAVAAVAGVGAGATRAEGATAVAYPESATAPSEHRGEVNKSRSVVRVPAQPGPLLARTARLTLVVGTLEVARTEVDRIMASVGGYVGQITGSDERGAV